MHCKEHSPTLPPSQRQQAKQSSVSSHLQQLYPTLSPPPVQHAGQKVVTPSQTTWPGSAGQLALTAMQLAALMLLEQETVVPN
jgi:hypothetical protein